MILNQKSQQLEVIVAKGMSEERLENAKRKVGEGLSGLVARDKKGLELLAAAQPENRIKEYLKRGEIARAFIVPINFENQVLGVLNLHTLKSNSAECRLEHLNSFSSLIAVAFQDI